MKTNFNSIFFCETIIIFMRIFPIIKLQSFSLLYLIEKANESIKFFYFNSCIKFTFSKFEFVLVVFHLNQEILIQ